MKSYGDHALALTTAACYNLINTLNQHMQRASRSSLRAPLPLPSGAPERKCFKKASQFHFCFTNSGSSAVVRRWVVSHWLLVQSASESVSRETCGDSRSFDMMLCLFDSLCRHMLIHATLIQTHSPPWGDRRFKRNQHAWWARRRWWLFGPACSTWKGQGERARAQKRSARSSVTGRAGRRVLALWIN